MEVFQTLFSFKLIFVLGVINLVSGLLVVSTCRCIPGLAITGNLMKYGWYKRFYKVHCYIWWVFWCSVVVHAIFAIGAVGVPF